MPKVTSYTPAWLSKPNPGHQIFTPTAVDTQSAASNGHHSSSKKQPKYGPRRTIARRGTEIFIAVGKEIRWADLVYLKEAWEDGQARSSGNAKGSGKGTGRDTRESQYSEYHAQGYRTIKTPVADDIRQLIISPYSNYLAILTTHTVHIAILPESSHLTAQDTNPLRLKTYTLGPTTHVTSQTAVASALWHPLGVNGTCLVTITEDAVVRLWELSVSDRWSFDKPTLSIDLKKLADGVSLDQDFSASAMGRSKGFSPDSFEMEVASACFAGRGSGGWSPMTLWVAMREGDVYALCPLLPEKWSPPSTLVPSLSVSIVAKIASMEDDSEASAQDKLLAQQQLAWMSDLDIQEPVHVEAPATAELMEIYTRPAKPGRIPKLQGPFDFELAPEESEDDLDSLLTDIYVIGPKLNSEELMFGEENDLELDEVDQEGLSMGIVCLITTSGRLSVCLDLDGVEAQWLPRTKSKTLRFEAESDPPSLLTFQVMDTSKAGEIWEGNWPVFSNDVNSRYSFYISDTSSINFISLSPWVFRLETELSEGAAGTDFRIDLLVKGQSSIRERIHTQKMVDHANPLSACTLLRDPDLGYFLLTATPYGPIALVFDAPEFDFDLTRRSRSPTYDSEVDKPLLLCEPRPVYEPSHTLDQPSSLPAFHERLQHSKYKRIMKEEVRLSPATLTIMTDAHKVLSEETHRLSTAAAELFRRCERLQVELCNQIKKTNEVACRVDSITGDDVEDGPALGSNEIIEQRIEGAQRRQKELAERLEKIRRKASKGTSRELSDKEKAWMQEVAIMETKVSADSEHGEFVPRRKKEPWERYEEVQRLKEDLLDQAEELSLKAETPGSRDVKVSSAIRKAKVEQVMKLLDRETALVEGTKTRLERLNLSD